MRRLDRLPLALINPALIFAVVFYTAFDVLAMLPVVAAAWVALRRPPRWWLWVWALCTLSLLIKHITLFQVWALFVLTFGVRRGLIAMLAAVIVFLASFLPFRDSFGAIFANVFLHAPDYAFGFHWFLPRWLAQIMFFAAMLIAPLIARYWLRLDLLRGMVFASYANVVFVYNIWVPHLLFPIWWAQPVIYSVIVALTMLAEQYLWGMIYPGQVIAWVCALITLLLMLAERHVARGNAH